MMLEPVNAEIDALAGSLKKRFAVMKSEQMGRKYSPHQRFRTPEIWIAAARRCVEAKADPHDFLVAAFTFCSVQGGPYPQHLGSQTAVQWYHAYLKTLNAHPGEDVYERLIKDKMVAALSHCLLLSRVHERRLRDILLDESLVKMDLAPAFIRVLLMPLDTDIRLKWAKEASADVRLNPRLYETLQKLECDLTWLLP